MLLRFHPSHYHIKGLLTYQRPLLAPTHQTRSQSQSQSQTSHLCPSLRWNQCQIPIRNLYLSQNRSRPRRPHSDS